MVISEGAIELSVTDAGKLGVAGLVAAVEGGAELVVTRYQRPVAAVVGVRRLVELEEAAADLRDLTLVLSHAATDTGRRTSLDDAVAAFGHTRESLAAIEDDE